MRIFSILACGALCLASAACNPGSERPLLLHYDAPATFFEQALPLGNGKLGAMVYGGPVEDRISLNDITLWTGEPDSGALHPDYQVVETLTPWGEAAGWVDKVREALDREDYRQADELQRHIQGHFSETYQPLGRLLLRFPEGEITEYRRSLDLADATATVSYRRDGKAFEAKYFVSAPDSVIVIKLSSEAPLDVTVSLEGDLPHTTTVRGSTLVSDGYAAWHSYPVYYAPEGERFAYDPQRGIHYRTVVSCPGAQPDGAQGLRIAGGREAMIVVANQTSFNGFDKDPVKEGREYRESALANASKAVDEGWSTLRKRHKADYGALFGRVYGPAASALCRRGGQPRTGGPLFPVRPLPAAVQLPYGGGARQPAGPVEREPYPALELQLHHQHQPGRELLACRAGRPWGNAPGAAGLHPQPVCERRAQRPGL